MLRFLTTWIVLILLLSVLVQSSWGKVVVYWLLWLTLLLLLFLHADELSSLIDLKALDLNG